MGTSTELPEVVRLDIRDIIAVGDEPFELILATVARVPEGGVLELTAPFEPVPLYAAMRRRGFVWHIETRSASEWIVTFQETGITSTATVVSIAARAVAARAVLAERGFDVTSDRTLMSAARILGVPVESVINELRRAVSQA